MQNRNLEWYLFVIVGLMVSAAYVMMITYSQDLEPTVPPAGIAATADPLQLAQVYALWQTSKHANTYDNGLGADTTCARCKSPLNWDPNNLAVEESLDCAACKRIPGEARPTLSGGVPVPEEAWQNIGCSICHQPVGDSFQVTASFWNQNLGIYESVESAEALCSHCHEGQHGFEVTEEIHADLTHPGWTCTNCHNPHGGKVQCVDCHDTTQGAAAQEHANHPNVQCTACHDRGGLGLWRDHDPESVYYNLVITRRFAHTLTSWPSHNLQTRVNCTRCHHAPDIYRPPIAQAVSCDNDACHPDGAVLFWCPIFPRGSSGQ